VYKWTFTIGANKIKYRLIISTGKDGNGKDIALQPVSGLLQQAYKKGSAVTVSVQYEWDWDTSVSKPSTWDADNAATPSKGPDVKIYYLGTDTDNKHGAAAGDGVTYPDESKKADGTTAAGLGSLTAPEEGGEYTATLQDKATASNYKLEPDTAGGYSSALNFKITPQEIAAPTYTPPSSGYVYDSQVKNITITSIDKDSMTFVEDKTNGYVASANDPDESKGEKLTFDKEYQKVRVKNAGEYTLKFKVSNTKNYKWAGDATKAEREIKITVAGAPIYVEWDNDITESTASDRWKWELGETGEISYEVKFTNNSGKPYQTDNKDDVVKIKLYWCKESDIADDKSYMLLNPEKEGKLQIKESEINYQSAGKFYLIAMVDTDDAMSANYAIDTNKKDADRQAFTVDSASVNTKALTWEYKSDKTSATFANWTTASELKFAFKDPDVTSTDDSGLSYTFQMKMGATGLDGYAYILLDTARSGFTSGYKLEKWDETAQDWVAATAIQDLGKYRVTAALKIADGDEEHGFMIKDNEGN
ncbi:MAG: hypothetical protein K2N84_07230, partial [Clostridia bacterium]|nr:hypothetical protein [Clostridia bacterium]